MCRICIRDADTTQNPGQSIQYNPQQFQTEHYEDFNDEDYDFAPLDFSAKTSAYLQSMYYVLMNESIIEKIST